VGDLERSVNGDSGDDTNNEGESRPERGITGVDSMIAGGEEPRGGEGLAAGRRTRVTSTAAGQTTLVMADQTRLGVGSGEKKRIVFVGFGEGGDGAGVWGFLSAAADCERVRLSEEKLKCAVDPHPCLSTRCSSTTAELPLFTPVILCPALSLSPFSAGNRLLGQTRDGMGCQLALQVCVLNCSLIDGCADARSAL
jgi:hypothetical protein